MRMFRGKCQKLCVMSLLQRKIMQISRHSAEQPVRTAEVSECLIGPVCGVSTQAFFHFAIPTSAYADS